MSNDAVNDFLFQQGGKSFPFEEVGDSVEGEILSCEIRQQTSVDTGELLTFSDGSPRKQLVVTLQTKLHDNDDDDGIRTVYAKGGRYDVATGEGTSMRDAIAEAVKSTSASAIEEGGTLVVAFTGLGVKKSKGQNAPKLYTAGYRKPKASVAASALFSDGE